MKNIFFFILIIGLLTACAKSTEYSQIEQNHWNGKPFRSLLAKIGPPSYEGTLNGQKFYAWPEEASKRTNYQKPDCELRAFVDNQENITKLENHTKISIKINDWLCRETMKKMLEAGN